MVIKALVLDADGVLTTPLKFAQYLQREHPAIAEQSREFFSGIFTKCIIGQADLREVLPAYLEKWGWPHSLDDFLNRWFDEEKAVDERLIAVVQILRESGIPCYVGTNQEHYRAHYMQTEMEFDAIFDRVFYSAAIGYRKPETGFYERVMGDLNLPGESIWFWDDTQRNVDGAIACGWHAELYVNFEDFVNKLTRVLDIQRLQSIA